MSVDGSDRHSKCINTSHSDDEEKTRFVRSEHVDNTLSTRSMVVTDSNSNSGATAKSSTSEEPGNVEKRDRTRVEHRNGGVKDKVAIEEEEEEEEEEENRFDGEDFSQPLLADMFKTITNLIGDLDVKKPQVNVKTKHSKGSKGSKGRGSASASSSAGSHIESVTTSLKKELDNTHVKIWRYVALNQKRVREHVCSGEIVELYREVAADYPDQPLTPWWTTFNGDTVLVCRNLRSFTTDMPKKQLYPNRFATSWFPEAAKWGIEFFGRVCIVPMNQTKYDLFKSVVKKMANSRPKPQVLPLNKSPSCEGSR